MSLETRRVIVEQLTTEIRFGERDRARHPAGAPTNGGGDRGA
ncbi:MAG TPA: hypothetical protein VGA38_00290 [Candidatus Limnocylindria bacterium]